MSQTLTRVLILGFFSVFLAKPLWAQGPRSMGQGGVIRVQVRYADGRPAPRGIHVRLESAEGGAEADQDTIQGGKCEFSLRVSGVYIVRISEREYKEVSVRVEIIKDPMAYVVLNLVPSKAPEPPMQITVPAGESTNIASVKDLAIPEDARKEFDKGAEAMLARNPEEGMKYFFKALKIYPDYPQAYRMLGEAYLQKQNWTEAETALKHSIQLEPNLTISYLDLGGLHNQTKNYPAAEQALKKCLELSPNTPAAQYELAKTYMATGRWQDATPLAESAVKTAPDLASAHVLLANIRLRQRDGVAALHEYQEYLRLEPNGDMAPQVRDMVAKLQKALGA